ncbi:class I SAM-dependent methyltransferase [Paenibacillus radicis (ex Gao et al. 2016)]|uniref:SAM-dependent methyltransferase n=1 Tax=Paenibacillus radicis (ex Gao et al. 2016) TaxID=1737354 RepID=A0A917MAP6_9BACL|nr:class I SAM-dependent methyltransferase [Paenibacillus radicis (ex Gao et al. 2016)]GGG88230.1 SAM-dependent methyltransferase [Paenibacillus radicis (ex Gao et al. 2016)]
MKQNKYDDDVFFEKYAQMERSQKGLAGAGEWQALRKMLPEFEGKRVLDLGCGYGWHCRYALEQGASYVVGVDISEKMLQEARAKTETDKAQYLCLPIEDIDFAASSFDAVISSLAFHYIESFDEICRSVHHCLSAGGDFVFSVEHPAFTANAKQDWHYGEQGERQHWPIDRYFAEGLRETEFLGENVLKYHKTLTSYVNALIHTGFEITGLVEPEPPQELLAVPGMLDEQRRPMMLLISARKK